MESCYCCRRNSRAPSLCIILFFLILCNLVVYFHIINLNNANLPLPTKYSAVERTNLPSGTNDFNEISSIGAEEYKSLQQKLAEANENWKRSNLRRHIAEKEEHFPNETISADISNLKTIWDYFYPSFDCPYTKERVGRAGDGGKWICGMKHLKSRNTKCLIYSFGISSESTFELELLQRTKCKVRMFDHTVDKPKLLDMFPEQTTFAKIGLDSTGNETDPNLKSLKTIMSVYKDTFIDVLKVDIEGAEWVGMNQIVLDFPEQLPFGQLLIEVHLHSFAPDNRHFLFRYFWYILEKAGLRAFLTEPNLFGEKFMFQEYSFLNILNGPYKLDSGPDFESIKHTYQINEIKI